MRKSLFVAGLVSALLVPAVSFAMDDAALDPATLPAAVIGGGVTVEAKVEAVNHETREVTLKTESGDTLTITAGPEVRNFDQIEVGDRLVAEYYEALAMALEKNGSGVQKRIEKVGGERAEPGDKPAGTVIHTIDAVGTVRDVDREQRLVFVEGTKGMVTLHVPESMDLDVIEAGDAVRAKYIKSVTLSVVE